MADTLVDLGAMQRRVDDLGLRIRDLRQRLKTGTDPKQTALCDQLAALEQRHRELGSALAKAGDQNARPEHHSVVAKLADDLDGAVGKFTDWVDAEEHAAPPPGSFSP